MTNANDLTGPSFEVEHHQNGQGLARLEVSSGLTKLEYFAALARITEDEITPQIGRIANGTEVPNYISNPEEAVT